VGLFDNVKAVGILAKKKATQAAQKANQAAQKANKEVENKFGEDDRYQSAKHSGNKAATLAKSATKGARQVGSEFAREVGETEVGKAVGRKARSATRKLASLPILSVAVDTAKARNGISSLHDAFADDPTDPDRALLLAEALERVRRDLLIYGRVRSAIEPSRLLVQQVVKTATGLGDTPTDPTQLRLLKVAFTLALKRLKGNPRDTIALHVLSRVYLTQGNTAEAARFAKLAILSDPSVGAPWITLARIYVAANQIANAERAARRSVDLGASYGNQVLADVVLAKTSGDELMAIDRYKSLRSRVTARGRRDYLGINVRNDKVIEGLWRAQRSKLQQLCGIGGGKR